MKFKREKDGAWVQPIRNGYKLACCDCGLVHKLDFKIVKRDEKHRYILFRAYRDNRSTGQMRRHIKSNLLEKKENL